MANPADRIASLKQPRRGALQLIPVDESTEKGVKKGRFGSPVDHPALQAQAIDVEDDDYAAMSDFVRRAKLLVHPFDQPIKLPPAVAQSLIAMATIGPSAVTQGRRDVLDWYRKMDRELEAKERALHAKLNTKVESIVADKRILLFKQMLIDIGYDDMGVVDLLITGVKIVGTPPRLGIWRPEDREAKISVRSLLGNAEEAKRKIGAGRKFAWSKLHQDLADIIADEVEIGLLNGPLTEEQMNVKLGSKAWVPARRFPLDQAGKLRPIDDFSEFGHNAAFGAKEKVTLKSLDTVVALSRAWLASDAGDGQVVVHDSAGRKLVAPLHPGWLDGKWSDLVGRVADLKGAYKQLPAHPAHACFNIIALPSEEGEIGYYDSPTMMFGQTAAVYGFLRFSRALAALALKLVYVANVEFFDDFTQVEPALTSESAHEALEGLFELLGWKVSVGDKRKPFSKEFVSLGVSVELPKQGLKEVLLKNKPGRVAAIGLTVKRFLTSDSLFGFKDALSFRGRIAFAGTYLWKDPGPGGQDPFRLGI